MLERPQIAISAVAILLAGCSAGVKVNADWSPGTDFSSYSTYGWIPDSQSDGSGQADHERLLDDILDIMERYENDAYLDYETELAAHLREWFTGHFKTRDARLHKMLG